MYYVDSWLDGVEAQHKGPHVVACHLLVSLITARGQVSQSSQGTLIRFPVYETVSLLESTNGLRLGSRPECVNLCTRHRERGADEMDGGFTVRQSGVRDPTSSVDLCGSIEYPSHLIGLTYSTSYLRVRYLCIANAHAQARAITTRVCDGNMAGGTESRVSILQTDALKRSLGALKKPICPLARLRGTYGEP